MSERLFLLPPPSSIQCFIGSSRSSPSAIAAAPNFAMCRLTRGTTVLSSPSGKNTATWAQASDTQGHHATRCRHSHHTVLDSLSVKNLVRARSGAEHHNQAAGANHAGADGFHGQAV